MDEKHQREEQLFTAALAVPAAARAAFVAESCAGDGNLRERVEALLRVHEDAASFLETSPERELAEVARHATVSPAEQPGSMIGRYKLLEKIGEGGCGIVYMAERCEPAPSHVALKIIKLGMDTKAVIARFDAERQALAMMDHPNIARALDAGATGGGRPFFVMELVRGTKITDWCDARRLPIDDRLRLFVQVCHAVQHAHQQGVIHRDLKPSNILVTSHDGVPMPKVIDFGIAKATRGRLTDQTLFTAIEQFVGTPAYMSPEQAELTSGDVDTRSDIYSLGVLLYELLTGRTPFDSGELKHAGADEIRRRIRDQQTPRPSSRLRTIDRETRTTAANLRRIEPLRLVHLLSGDLDWIAMRCLEKDRTRRYETADALARDIERYLASEPVTARPPSGFYLLAKFVGRHRVGVAAGGAVAVALLAGFVVSTRLYLREAAALKRAEENERKANTAAVRSAQVARFMQDMLGRTDVPLARGRDTKLLREVLEQTARRLDNEVNAEPEVEAELRAMLGEAFAGLADYSTAAAMQRRALTLVQGVHGPDHPKTLVVFEQLAESIYLLGRRAEGARMYREALERRRRISPEEDLPLATAIYRVGRALTHEGKFAEAEAAFRTVIRIQEKLLPAEAPALLDTRIQLAYVLQRSLRLPEAEAAYRDALSRYRDTMEYSVVSKDKLLQDLGRILIQRRKFAEAESLLRESLALQKQRFAGDDSHPRARRGMALTLGYLGGLLRQQRRWPEAEAVERESLRHYETELAADPENITFQQEKGKALVNLSEILLRQQRQEEAENVAREAVALFRPLPPSMANWLPNSLLRLAQTLGSRGRWDEAAAAYQDAHLCELDTVPSTRRYAIAHGWLDSLERQEQPAAAQAAAAMLVAGARKTLRIYGRDTSGLCIAETLQALVAHRQFESAEPFAHEMLKSWEEHDPEAWQTSAFRSLVGNIWWARDRAAEAEPLLRAGHEGLQRLSDRVPPSTGNLAGFAFRSLEQFLIKTGRQSEAAALRMKVEGTEK